MLKQVSEHVWYLPSETDCSRPALGYIHCGNRSLIVDTGNSPEHISEFYGYIRAAGLPDPSYAMVTHWHWDHIFGLTGFPEKSLGTVMTNDRLQNMLHWEWSDSALNSRVAAGLEIPVFAELIKRALSARHSFKVKSLDIVFRSQMGVRLNELNVQLVHVGGPHSEDSTIAWVPEDKILFLGDCYLEDVYTGGGSIRLGELRQLLKTLDAFDADLLISSHDEPISKKEFMQQMGEVVRLGEMVGSIDDLTEAKKLLKETLKRDLDERELYYTERFVNGNRYTFIPFRFEQQNLM